MIERSQLLHPVPRQLQEEEEEGQKAVARRWQGGGAICFTCSSGLFILGGEKWPYALPFSQICKSAPHATQSMQGVCLSYKFAEEIIWAEIFKYELADKNKRHWKYDTLHVHLQHKRNQHDLEFRMDVETGCKMGGNLKRQSLENTLHCFHH